MNVTRRRVAQVAGVVEPSEEVKRAFNEKYHEVFAVGLSTATDD